VPIGIKNSTLGPSGDRQSDAFDINKHSPAAAALGCVRRLTRRQNRRTAIDRNTGQQTVDSPRP